MPTSPGPAEKNARRPKLILAHIAPPPPARPKKTPGNQPLPLSKSRLPSPSPGHGKGRRPAPTPYPYPNRVPMPGPAKEDARQPHFAPSRIAPPWPGPARNDPNTHYPCPARPARPETTTHTQPFPLSKSCPHPALPEKSPDTQTPYPNRALLRPAAVRGDTRHQNLILIRSVPPRPARPSKTLDDRI